jgi:hypothetical protein
MRALRSSGPALPYIARLIVFKRLIWPSAWPLLQGNSMALRTAPMSRRRTRANRTIGESPELTASSMQISSLLDSVAGTTGDLGTGQPFLEQGVNHLEHRLPRLSMSVAHPAPMRCLNVPIILNRIDLRAPDTFIGQQCPPRGAARKAHLLLDCDPQVVHEMEPISHLARACGAPSRRACA